HAPSAAGAVVHQISTRFDLVGNRQEDEIGHQVYDITRRKMLARLFIVLFVEAADQLFEDRNHGMIVKGWKSFSTISIEDGLRTEVDRGVEKLLDQAAEDVGFDQCGDLVTKLELF